jgi:hypothetical protein
MGWVVNAMPRPLYTRERPVTHCIGGSVGPRAGLDWCGKSRPPPGSDPQTVKPVASRYTDWDIPVIRPNITYMSVSQFHKPTYNGTGPPPHFRTKLFWNDPSQIYQEYVLCQGCDPKLISQGVMRIRTVQLCSRCDVYTYFMQGRDIEQTFYNHM